jgi:hypothetical protein
MRIEQQLHKAPLKSFSTSPLPIWSKSSGTEIWPVRKPTRFTCPASGAPNAITFTWLAGFGDHERLAVGGPVDQAGQVGFGLVNIDRLHSATNRLSLIGLVYYGSRFNHLAPDIDAFRPDIRKGASTRPVSLK